LTAVNSPILILGDSRQSNRKALLPKSLAAEKPCCRKALLPKSLAAEKPCCSLVELTTINANSFAASHLFLVVSGGISTGRSGYHGCERGA